jgi:DNA-binding beta-propeller fold protein YncE
MALSLGLAAWVAGSLISGAAVGGGYLVLTTSGPFSESNPSQIAPDPEPPPLPATPTQPSARDAIVSTITGRPELKGPPRDGPPGVARFGDPGGVAVGPDGAIYVADFENKVILRVDTKGNTTRIAGSGIEGVQDGPALSAEFTGPTWLAVGTDGAIYISDGVAHRIRKLDSGVVSTLAGGGPAGLSEGLFRDARGTDARFDAAAGLVIDDRGNLIVADYNNNRIRRVTPDGDVTTIAGTGESGHRDGSALEAKFNFPAALALAPDGSIYVTEHGNNDIRRLSPDGQVTTLLPYEYERLHHPSGIAVSDGGQIFIADTGGSRILELMPNGSLRLVAGNGKPEFMDGTGASARVGSPGQLAWHPAGMLVFGDKANAAIRKVELK